MTEPPPQLDYAMASPFYRRRVVRQAVIAAALLALGGVGYHYLEPFVHRARAMFALRRVEAITYPPTQVAWEEDPARIAAWTGGAASGSNWGTLNDRGRVRAVYLTPPALRGYFTIPNVVGDGASAIYVGTRDGGAGSRLVSIAMVEHAYNDRQTGALMGNGLFHVTTVHPGTFTTDLVSFRMYQWRDHSTFAQIPPGELRLYWGQSDPADAARFTIRFESPATSGTVDCRLLPDDTVQFKVIPNPATAPSR